MVTTTNMAVVVEGEEAGLVWQAVAPSGEAQAQFVGSDGTLNQLWWIDDPAAVAAFGVAFAAGWIISKLGRSDK